jgi:cytochrome oxidase Cu insertion factor (SCO1/SenC/PrrC family)
MARILRGLATITVSALLGAGAMAQTSPTLQPVGAALQLSANDTRGQPFNLAAIRGKVAVVFIWSTSCAVCRDSLPELRANLRGWKDKPFALVSVNVDRITQDWQAYEAAVSKTQPVAGNWISVHQRADTPPAARLPVTLLVDAQGKVLSRYEGRLAPEVWDNVAEILP